MQSGIDSVSTLNSYLKNNSIISVPITTIVNRPLKIPIYPYRWNEIQTKKEVPLNREL